MGQQFQITFTSHRDVKEIRLSNQFTGDSSPLHNMRWMPCYFFKEMWIFLSQIQTFWDLALRYTALLSVNITLCDRMPKFGRYTVKLHMHATVCPYYDHIICWHTFTDTCNSLPCSSEIAWSFLESGVLYVVPLWVFWAIKELSLPKEYWHTHISVFSTLFDI